MERHSVSVTHSDHRCSFLNRKELFSYQRTAGRRRETVTRCEAKGPITSRVAPKRQLAHVIPGLSIRKALLDVNIKIISLHSGSSSFGESAVLPISQSSKWVIFPPPQSHGEDRGHCYNNREILIRRLTGAWCFSIGPFFCISR